MATYKILVTISGATVEEVHLVEAKNEARAIAHAVAIHVRVSKPTSAELVELGAAGVVIEVAE